MEVIKDLTVFLEPGRERIIIEAKDDCSLDITYERLDVDVWVGNGIHTQAEGRVRVESQETS